MQCTNCGASISAEQLSRPDCPYCGTALPHQVRAAERVALVEKLLTDTTGDGIPDALEGLVHGAEAGAPGTVVTTQIGGATVQRVVSSEVVIVNGVVQSGQNPPAGFSQPMQFSASAPRQSNSAALMAIVIALGVVLMMVVLGMAIFLAH